MSDPKQEENSLLAGLKWPLIVVALLVGHATLMMVALTASQTIPLAVQPTPEVAATSEEGP